MQVVAKAKYLRGSAQKARLVADVVRGMKATYALEVLKYLRKGAAPEVRKVVQSAVANATNNHNLDAESLVIAQIMVDEAPMFKRGRAESKGRYRKILKRNNHVTVVLDQIDEAPKAVVKASKAAKATQADSVEAEAPAAETKAKAKPKTTKKPTAKKAATSEAAE